MECRWPGVAEIRCGSRGCLPSSIVSQQKKTVVLVVGTRPEAIKMAPVYLALQRSSVLTPFLLSTGQHREMLRQALASFGIEPDHDLSLMAPGQDLVELTGKVLNAVYRFLLERRPSAVLVQGDTTSVLAAALAANFADVPVGHVEAGLRTYQMRNPWPEEMNRRLTAPLCRWSFAPTEASAENLRREQIPAESCFVTGNTVIDALLWTREQFRDNQQDDRQQALAIGISDEFASRHFGDTPFPFLLVTGHRRESFGAGFERICEALKAISRRFPDIGLLYPVHLNPAVREPVQRILGGQPRIELIEPVDYREFVWLMDRSKFILSDSGGVQEEAPSLGKPVLVMRENTERPEGVAAGTCHLVGTDPERILQAATRWLTDTEAFQRRCNLRNPYGDGRAAERIREILEAALTESETPECSFVEASEWKGAE